MSKKKEQATPEITLVKTGEQTEKVPFVRDEEGIAKKKAQLIKKKNDYDNKRFLITDDADVIASLKAFVFNDCKWTYTESLGVLELEKIFSKTDKQLSLSVIELEALHYFLKKKDGVGLDSAAAYVKMLTPIGEAMGKAQKEYENLQTLEFELTSLEQGIEIAKPVK